MACGPCRLQSGQSPQQAADPGSGPPRPRELADCSGGERASPRPEPARAEARPRPHLLSSVLCAGSRGQLIFFYCFPALRGGERNSEPCMVET